LARKAADPRQPTFAATARLASRAVPRQKLKPAWIKRGGGGDRMGSGVNRRTSASR